MKKKTQLTKKSSKSDSHNVVLKQQRARELKKQEIHKEQVKLKGANEDGVKGKDKKKMRNEVLYHLRDLVLERDNYTCQGCGKSKEKNPDIRLQVDHIIPLEHGGTNDLDNLQTLCLKCNRNKSSSIPEEVAEKFFHENVEYNSITKFIKSGNNNIKEYFLSDESLQNRNMLYKYYEFTKEACPKNCASCMSVDDGYLECFDTLMVNIPKENGVSVATTNTSITTVTDALTISTDRGINVLLDDSTKQKCNTCYLADRCGHFRIGGTCVYDWTGGIDFTDAKVAVPVLLQEQAKRVMKAMTFERVDGGVPDKNTTTEMQILMDMYSQFHDMQQDKFGLSINIKGQTQGQQGGDYMQTLMSKIFGGEKQQVEKTTVDAIDVPHTEIASDIDSKETDS